MTHKKEYRGKLVYKKKLYRSGTSKVMIIPNVFINYLNWGERPKLLVYLDPYNERIIIKKENENEIR